jgi:type II secretory pathway component GspD/PulD (secretin)
MFADKAGLNIIFHSSVEGKITLDLVNVTLNDAFKMIMQMSELSYVIDNDTLMVMSAEASKKIDVSKENMSIIPVRYVDASAIAQFLNKNIFSINKPGLSNNEIVVTNPLKNELLIFGTENDYKMARKIVEKLDTKPRATTYKVNHTTPKEMATLICETLFSSQGAEGGTTGGAAEGEEISLGGGVVACRVSNSVNTEKLTSFNNSTLSIVYQPSLGTISVFGGSIEQINMINEFITANDRKQPQAYIEFSIVELNEQGSKEFNNNWQIWSKNFSGSFDNNGLASNPIYSTFWKGNGYTMVDDAGETIKSVSKYAGPLTISQNISYIINNG